MKQVSRVYTRLTKTIHPHLGGKYVQERASNVARIVIRAFQQAKRAAELDSYLNAGNKWTSSYEDDFMVPSVLLYSEEELEEERELIKAQEAFEEAEAVAAKAVETPVAESMAEGATVALPVSATQLPRAAGPKAAVAFAELVPALEPPDEFVCPISQELMEDPVLASDGHAYERQEIERWFEKRLTSPKTGEPLETRALFPNHPLRRLIIEWREAHGV